MPGMNEMYVRKLIANLLTYISFIPGMYYTLPEITPAIKAPGDYRFNKTNDRINGKFAGPQLDARALIEGQFMAKRIHAVKMGLNIGKLL